MRSGVEGMSGPKRAHVVERDALALLGVEEHATADVVARARARVGRRRRQLHVRVRGARRGVADPRVHARVGAGRGPPARRREEQQQLAELLPDREDGRDDVLGARVARGQADRAVVRADDERRRGAGFCIARALSMNGHTPRVTVAARRAVLRARGRARSARRRAGAPASSARACRSRSRGSRSRRTWGDSSDSQIPRIGAERAVDTAARRSRTPRRGSATSRRRDGGVARELRGATRTPPPSASISPRRGGGVGRVARAARAPTPPGGRCA